MAGNGISGAQHANGNGNGNGLAEYQFWPTLRRTMFSIVKALASLKLTVALMGMAIFLVLAGTLALTGKDMWEVTYEYFRVPLGKPGPFWQKLGLVWIDFQLFFPPAFFPGREPPQIPGGFFFLNGWLIGGLMMVNLLAAHTLRFKIQARGPRLWVGLGVVAVGVLATVGVILSGSNKDGILEASWLDWSHIWTIFLGLLGLVWLTIGYVLVLTWSQQRLLRWLLVPLDVGLGALLLFLLVKGNDARLGDEAMRILWQLIKAGGASLLLLAGCWLAFKKRAGIVLLHAGVALIMINEAIVGLNDALYGVEAQMTIVEGDTSNYTEDIRSVELAIVDPSDPETDRVAIVPHAMLRQEGSVISHEDLPFDVEIVRYIQNAWVHEAGPGDAKSNPATAGAGLYRVARKSRPSVGTDQDAGVDNMTVYARLLEKGTGQAIGTYLFPLYEITGSAMVEFGGQEVVVDGKVWDVSLRFKREYKPYSFHLMDFQKNDYVGTSKARDFSSFVKIRYPEQNIDREGLRIWMNNPLRFAGETFYQSAYRYEMSRVNRRDPETGLKTGIMEIDPRINPTTGRPVVNPGTDEPAPKWIKEATILQVVKDTGWMIPYVGCVIVGVGMGYQFLLVLLRFLNRMSTPAAATSAAPPLTKGGPGGVESRSGSNKGTEHKDKQRRSESAPEPSLYSDRQRWQTWATWLSVVSIVVVFGALVARITRAPDAPTGELNLYEFGRLPVVYLGRAKPFDTMARNSLRLISDRETFAGPMDPDTFSENWTSIRDKLVKKWRELSEEDLDAFDGDRFDGDIEPLVDLIAKKTVAERQEVEAFVKELTSVRYPAIRWLLDVIARPEVAAKHEVFRVDNLDVLSTLGLERRKGYRYSLAEIRDKADQFQEQVKRARTKFKQDKYSLDIFERKIIDLDDKVHRYLLLSAAFGPPRLGHIPSESEADADPQSGRRLIEVMQTIERLKDRLERMEPPLAVPGDGDDEWQAFSVAWAEAYVHPRMAWLNRQLPEPMFSETPSPRTLALAQIFASYEQSHAVGVDPEERAEGVKEFNRAVNEYRALLEKDPPDQFPPARVNAEAYYNHVAPLFYSTWAYVAAFVITALAWLLALAGLHRTLNWTAFALIACTFVLHSFALVSRIYISDRPPVTNLYSSAVFIGWGAVLFGLVIEAIFRLGIGNVIGSVGGFLTLLVAGGLANSGSGDTFEVVVAVLDTTFWLSTHVICITMGYAATYVAGLLGIVYVLAGLCTPALSQRLEQGNGPASPAAAPLGALSRGSLTVGQILTKMIYGTLCFAIFFSFVGTILGGLWADDSWGRFWGWDPKENGALIIVLWNALVLHARWDGLVKDRGLAVLAIAGNIPVTWSWFVTNQLGIGLHSYGFTEGVLLFSGWFIASQLAIVGMGLLPKQYWSSFRRRDEQSEASA